MNILVVEDEKSLSKAITKKLEVSGFEVINASTAAEAKDALDGGEKIDAIWLDHYLIGEESGLEVLYYIKSEDSKYKNIPVYVVSNTATPEKIEQYISLGIDKYYVKSDTKLESIINDIKLKIKA